MEKITNFSIFKVTDKKKDNHPDYKLSTKIGDEYVEIGGGWIKDFKGGKFISCKLSTPYEARNGYHIEVDLADKQPVPKFERDSQGKPVGEKVADEIDPSSIPF